MSKLGLQQVFLQFEEKRPPELQAKEFTYKNKLTYCVEDKENINLSTKINFYCIENKENI